MVGRLLKVLQSRWDYVRFIYGQGSRVAWELVALLVALLGLSLPRLLPGPVVAGVNAIAMVIAGVSAVVGAVVTFRTWRAARLVPYTPEPVAGIQWTDSGWHHRDSFAATRGVATRLWWSPQVDRCLWQRSTDLPREGEVDDLITPARLDPTPYRLPSALQEVAAAALRHSGRNWQRTLRLPVRFNGRCLGLGVEPTEELLTDGELSFLPVRYFDGECSNELWGFRIHRRDEMQTMQPRALALDRAGRALSLDQSRAANIVGISMYAVTRDDKVMLIQQTQGNSIAPGALASSSSGSLDLADFPARPTGSWWGGRRPESPQGVNGLRVLLSGMLRELDEECLVRPAKLPGGGVDRFAGEVVGASARVTGYWRWESRAMKPEFSGLVRVDVSSEELISRKHRGGESTFTHGLLAVDADVLTQAAARVTRSQPDEWAAEAVDLLRAGVCRARGQEATQEQIEAVELSPSGEQAWVHAVRFVADSPQWLPESAITPRR